LVGGIAVAAVLVDQSRGSRDRRTASKAEKLFGSPPTYLA